MAQGTRNPDHLKLVLYADLVSQPARAVVAFCQKNKINFERKDIGVMRGGARTEDFAKISPTKKIPVMQEIDERTGEIFTLVESHTIMRYLADTRGVPDHWFPRESRDRALVNMYLD